MVLMLLLVVPSAASGNGPEWVGFPISGNDINRVEQGARAALETDKLLLIVLGANWCPDSQAVLDMTSRPQIRSLLDEKYEVIRVNVGDLDRGYDVLAEYTDQLVYTHTPQVLIIDPATKRQLNWKDHWMWRNAAKRKAEELEFYLARNWRAEKQAAWSTSEEDIFAAINLTELQEMSRLLLAYEQMGPLMKSRPTGFQERWAPVADLRYNIINDFNQIREDVYRRQEAGEVVTLDQIKFPTYQSFAWEMDAE